MQFRTVTITRKYNLESIGHKYETIEITREGDSVEEIIQEIEKAYRIYVQQIVNGKVA